MTDLRTLRASLGLSQPKFARLLGTPYHTYRGWETGRKSPPPIVGVVCAMLNRQPQAMAVILTHIAQEREAAARPPPGGLPDEALAKSGETLPAHPDAS